MSRLKVITLVLCVVGMTRCVTERNNNNNTYDWEIGTVITKRGYYSSEKFGLNLDITIDDKIVNYSLYDSNQVLLYESSKPSISNVHRWAFMIDEKGVVWVYSSDIGLYLLRKGETQKYELNSFGVIDEEKINDIPKGIYEILPDLLKKKASI